MSVRLNKRRTNIGFNQSEHSNDEIRCRMSRAKVRRFLNVGSNARQRVVEPTVRKHPIAAETTGPASNAFDLASLVANDRIAISTKPSVPTFTFRSSRPRCKSADDATPGPGDYFEVDDGDGVRERKPPVSRLKIPLRSGVVEKQTMVAPGPADYFQRENENESNKRERPPQIRKDGRQGKTIKPSVFTTPAPNAYRIPSLIASLTGHKRSAPACSMHGRLPTADEDFDRPGPGDYDNRYDFSMRKDPQFTMGFRRQPPNNADAMPGPGKYRPERAIFARKSVPAFTLGTKHTIHRGLYSDNG